MPCGVHGMWHMHNIHHMQPVCYPSSGCQQQAAMTHCSIGLRSFLQTLNKQGCQLLGDWAWRLPGISLRRKLPDRAFFLRWSSGTPIRFTAG